MARANLVPGLMLQATMLALVPAYYLHPPVKELLDHLAVAKACWGYGYSAVAAVVAGAFVLELLRIGVFQRGRVERRNFSNLRFTIPFWCAMGVTVDLFYRQQGAWLGNEPTVATVVKKVLMDQFVYNPLFAAPMTVWLYAWKQGGYRWRREFLTARYYRERIVPTLVAT